MGIYKKKLSLKKHVLFVVRNKKYAMDHTIDQEKNLLFTVKSAEIYTLLTFYSKCNKELG